MEANEAGELQEHAEHGAHEPSMRPVAFTMSVLAVLVAVVTVLGHRTHTAAVLYQAKASDQWNFYQAKKIREDNLSVDIDMLQLQPMADPKATEAKLVEYRAHIAKWNDELKEGQEKAQTRLLGGVLASESSLVGKVVRDGGGEVAGHASTASPSPRATSRSASTATLA